MGFETSKVLFIFPPLNMASFPYRVMLKCAFQKLIVSCLLVISTPSSFLSIVAVLERNFFTQFLIFTVFVFHVFYLGRLHVVVFSSFSCFFLLSFHQLFLMSWILFLVSSARFCIVLILASLNI